MYYPIYDTSRRYPDRASVASQSVYHLEHGLNKKNPPYNTGISQEFITFGVPHNLTYYATRSVLQFNNFLQNKAGGATRSVWLCGNSQNPGCLIVSPSNSYQS